MVCSETPMRAVGVEQRLAAALDEVGEAVHREAEVAGRVGALGQLAGQLAHEGRVVVPGPVLGRNGHARRLDRRLVHHHHEVEHPVRDEVEVAVRAAAGVEHGRVDPGHVERAVRDHVVEREQDGRVGVLGEPARLHGDRARLVAARRLHGQLVPVGVELAGLADDRHPGIGLLEQVGDVLGLLVAGGRPPPGEPDVAREVLRDGRRRDRDGDRDRAGQRCSDETAPARAVAGE